MTETRKFIVGKTYFCRSTCDYDCIFTFKVIKRTEKTVWLDSGYGIKSRRVSVYQNEETVLPQGSFSMAPCLGADDLIDAEKEVTPQVTPQVTPEVFEFPAPFTVIIGGKAC